MRQQVADFTKQFDTLDEHRFAMTSTDMLSAGFGSEKMEVNADGFRVGVGSSRVAESR